MARKNFIKAHEMLKNEPLQASLISPTTNTQMLDKASIKLNWTDPTAAGEVKVEAKIHDPNLPDQNQNWYQLDFGEVIAISSDNTDQQLLVILNDLQFTDLRLKIDCTIPVGEVTAILNARTEGA